MIENAEDRDGFAALMAEEMKEVIEELHTIDPVDLVSFIRFGQFSAIEDLLQSSTELFFKEGTLTFGWTAAVDMSWSEPPTVTLGMEFTHKTVSVFFNLSLRAIGQMVDIASVIFDPVCPDVHQQRLCLIAALGDAHLAGRKAACRRPVAPLPNPRDGRPLLSRPGVSP